MAGKGVPGPRGMRGGPKAKDIKGSLSRLIKFLISDYKKHLILVLICLVFWLVK